ncbi:RNA-binding protein pno1 [Aedes albopictus]|uniref:Putative rna-binding protein pno1p n=1 Tax=Aedes albopictus TaxID=7160 RepID=A0A023EI90_AEDAL|nr:RNA-binding protein pno1 [Aedes albopictus]XP_019545907.1 RNA-binding protein pno1 [Aedes albopictus]
MDVDVQEIPASVEQTKKSKPRIKKEIRKVFVPRTRQSALKEQWMKIFTPVVEQLLLQIRYDVKSKQVELRLGPETKDPSNLQKAADFVRAFMLGFEVEDALALLRLDDLFIESFEVNDVKMLKGDHLSRAIGRLAGKGGRTKFTLENSTKTRIVLQDSKIHILGNYKNIQQAKRAVSHLVLGSPASKVYGNLRTVAGKMSERM